MKDTDLAVLGAHVGVELPPHALASTILLPPLSRAAQPHPHLAGCLRWFPALFNNLGIW